MTYSFIIVRYMRVTPDPSPLAYCVPPYFGLRTALFWLAYCVPFNNKNNHFGCFHLHKEDKIKYVVCTCTTLLKTLALMCLLVKFPRC